MTTATLPRSFEEFVAGSDLPILVDFWAEWCGPCRIVSPAVQQIAREFKGRIVVVKVNVDEKPHVSNRYAIQSIPTLMVFDKGKIVARQSGAMRYEDLRLWVERALS